MVLRHSTETASLISMQVLVGKKFKINCPIKHTFPTMGHHKMAIRNKKKKGQFFFKFLTLSYNFTDIV